jgi:hypothetical protein
MSHYTRIITPEGANKREIPVSKYKYKHNVRLVNAITLVRIKLTRGGLEVWITDFNKVFL